MYIFFFFFGILGYLTDDGLLVVVVVVVVSCERKQEKEDWVRGLLAVYVEYLNAIHVYSGYAPKVGLFFVCFFKIRAPAFVICKSA